MDAVRIETLPNTKSLVNASATETTDNSEGKDEAIFSVDEISEDDEIQLRLSDDEDTEPDNVSDHSKCPQTNIHPQNKDLKLLDCTTPAKKLKTNGPELPAEQHSCKEESALIIEDETSEISLFHEKSSDELGNTGDQDSTMSGSEKPPYVQSSPKYWNNHFDKRWSGVSSPRDRHSFQHRNGGDWYRREFPDKNQFNHKSHINNHNNQYCRLRSSSRGSYDQSRDNWKRDSERESKNKFLRSRKSLEKTGVTSPKENGVCDDTSVVKHDTKIDKEESFAAAVSQNGEEVGKVKKDCDQKIDEIVQGETKVFSGSENASPSVQISDKLEENESKSIDSENPVPVQDSSDNVLTQTKDCDAPLTEKEKSDECSSGVGKVEKERESNLQDITGDSTENAKSKSPSSNEEQTCSTEELLNGEDALVSDATSVKDNNQSKHDENLMEVDENNTNSCDSGFTNSTNNGKSSSSDNSKDSDLELSESNDKNTSENVANNEKVPEQKEDGLDDFDDSHASKTVDDVPSSEDTSKISDERSMVTDDTDKNLENDEPQDDLTTSVHDEQLSKVTNQEALTSCLLVESKRIDVSPDNIKHSTEVDSVEDSEHLSKVDETGSDQDASGEDELEIDLQESEPKSPENGVGETNDSMKMAESDEHDSVDNIVEEVDLIEDEMEVSDETPSIGSNLSKPLDDTAINDSFKDTDEMDADAGSVVHKKHGRRKELGIECNDVANEDDAQEEHLSTKSTEDSTRKDATTSSENEDSREDSEDLIQVSHKKANVEELRSSPSVQKRALEDVDPSAANTNTKRIRMSSELPSLIPMTTQPCERRDHPPISKENAAKTSELVRKVSTELGNLKKMTLEEIEALVLQKITESLTFRGENGKLREEVKSLKRSLEASRTKTQQLQKQVEGFDMVLKRISYDKNSNADKYLPPIKINRSVGLQVNFLSSEHGVQNLKQIQMRTAASGGSGTSPVKTIPPLQDSGNRPSIPSPRKQVKIRSPRRPEAVGPVPMSPAPTSPVATMTPMANGQVVNSSPQMSGLTPLNRQTPEIIKRPLTLPSTGSVIKDLLQQQPQQTLHQPIQQQQQHHHLQTHQQNLMHSQQQSYQVQQSIQVQQQQFPQTQQLQLGQQIVVASSLNNQPTNRTIATMNNNAASASNNSSDLIDLTDEEEKTKPPVVVPITSTSGYPRLLQAVPTSVSLSNATNLRLVQTSVQSPPNAVVNSAGRILYTVPSHGNGPRQIVLANSNTIRPVTTLNAKNMPNLTYKQVMPALQNGTVRVLTTSGTQNVIPSPIRHPAPLPETPVMESNPKWKMIPPAPSLKISKVANGIVLSWNMILSDKFAEIVSYQLYAYQEISGTAPNAAQWKKVGDVRALPLPMACTLTQFTAGNNYYFAVRAVDIHSRLGQYSKPGNISL
ncbi:hypothetical protein QAD02_000975 [Eretmocerus hayati]|uniref:Uncharacterized protein n=1 Tax=Eretmocerus hayati TaxID=131215 RepID=A0ACC2NGD1_9HYME|nr:hypothetical protein QAD02_000975 [Eretmocerus hayati]